MAKPILYVSLLLTFLYCTDNPSEIKNQHSEINEESNIQDSLAFTLCEMFGLDQGIRDPEIFSILGRNSRKVDTLSFIKLVEFIKAHGYPNKELIGEKNWEHECVAMAAMAIMLHNSYRLVNEKEYFDLFLNEVEKGNMKREFLATVLDKHYWSKSRGEKVLYGSQFGTPCIDTKEETNRLRAQIGLASLEDNEFKVCD